jgi:hypothetical protein
VWRIRSGGFSLFSEIVTVYFPVKSAWRPYSSRACGNGIRPPCA